MATDEGRGHARRRARRFDCTVYREAEAGDHLIVVLNLHAVDHPQSGSPLDFNHSGFSLYRVKTNRGV
jgi:flavin reductase (DIM6/NTAB) family NADH-FMN oxidoreductase RutF